jgi:hypothetical protein
MARSAELKCKALVCGESAMARPPRFEGVGRLPEAVDAVLGPFHMLTPVAVSLSTTSVIQGYLKPN